MPRGILPPPLRHPPLAEAGSHRPQLLGRCFLPRPAASSCGRFPALFGPPRSYARPLEHWPAESGPLLSRAAVPVPSAGGEGPPAAFLRAPAQSLTGTAHRIRRSPLVTLG